MQSSRENAKTTLRKVAEQLMSLANQGDQGGFRTFRAFVLIIICLKVEHLLRPRELRYQLTVTRPHVFFAAARIFSLFSLFEIVAKF